MQKIRYFLFIVLLGYLPQTAFGKDWIVYEPEPGPGKGKHVVFLAGDEEYRSEEGLPMLAKILSQRHGFKCTVCFSIGKKGLIDPNNQKSLSNAKALDSADAIVMLLRFRNYPDKTMKHFVDAYERGLPIIALRTSTHAFRMSGKSKYRKYSSFGKRVLGEGWVSHWGRHKREATRGVIEPSAKKLPILNGVKEIFGDTDVYEAHPPKDVTVLVRGMVLKGMKATDPPAKYQKKTRGRSSKKQDVNDPMMPVAWTRIWKNEAEKVNRVFCTTMGSSTDLQSAGLRRLVVNAVYWGLIMDIPKKANVNYIGTFKPTMYGFNRFQRNVRPADLAIKSKD